MGPRAQPWSLGKRRLSQSERRYGPAIEAHFQFLLWLIPAVEKFPRAQRFLLGDCIQTTALDVLEDRRQLFARPQRRAEPCQSRH